MNRLLRSFLPPVALAASVLAVSTAEAATAISDAQRFAPRQLLVKFEGEATGRAVTLAEGTGVLRAARVLRQNPDVLYAEPN